MAVEWQQVAVAVAVDTSGSFTPSLANSQAATQTQTRTRLLVAYQGSPIATVPTKTSRAQRILRRVTYPEVPA